MVILRSLFGQGDRDKACEPGKRLFSGVVKAFAIYVSGRGPDAYAVLETDEERPKMVALLADNPGYVQVLVGKWTVAYTEQTIKHVGVYVAKEAIQKVEIGPPSNYVFYFEKRLKDYDATVWCERADTLMIKLIPLD